MKEEPLSFEELQLFNRREMIIRSGLAVPFAAIIWRLWNLQVKNGKTYNELSKGNRIRLKSIAAPRGIIYDRNGIILAKNIPSYILTLVREDVPDISAVLRKVSFTLKIPLPTLEKALKAKSKVARFHPIQIYEDLTLRQIALIETYQEEFPGISIEVAPRRYYPMLQTGAHVFGYMSEITKSQLKKLPLKKVKSAKLYGQEGVEAVYNSQLIGTDGGKQVEVNNTGREIKTFPNQVDPVPGNDIILSIDAALQKKVEAILGDRKGAAVVMNPHNGEVLAMASLPAFDPNEFSQGLSFERWQEMKNHPHHILNNKSIQGGYSPGSTFKMVVAAAALEEGLIDSETEIKCEGAFRLKRTVMHCWKRSGHGLLNVTQAIENSCNVFFYKLAMELGIETIKEYATKFGLGINTGIDLFGESRGIVPDKQWKLERFEKEWLKGETPNVAIGQGFLTTTPIQLVNYINVIANGGTLVQPRIVKQVVKNADDEDKKNDKANLQFFPTEIHKRGSGIKPETLAILKEGMRLNVQGQNGTGKRAKSKIVSVAGKTGTTQVVSIKTREKIKRERGEVDEKYLNHAWFVGFAPVENPMITTVVMIEHGQAGRNSAKLTKEIIDFYFTNIESVPEPAFEPEQQEVDEPIPIPGEV